jgi:hypothetical protein
MPEKDERPHNKAKWWGRAVYTQHGPNCMVADLELLIRQTLIRDVRKKDFAPSSYAVGLRDWIVHDLAEYFQMLSLSPRECVLR